METLEFLKEERRMCASFDAMCVKCPLGDTGCCVIVGDTDRELENEVTAVEQWAKEHPIKTRQSVFLKMLPNVSLDRNGIINISPCRVDPKQYPFNGKNCGRFSACSQCRREFWEQEVE